MKNKFHKIKNIVLDKNLPVSLIHFITNRCNARCPHCFIDFDDSNSQNSSLSLENIEKLSKSLGPQVMNINLTGGEPFLCNEISEISQLYFKNSSIDSIYISTHGGFPKKIKKYVDEVTASFPNKTIIFSISIDHLENEHNEYRKVKNLFNNAIESYHYLNDSKQNAFQNLFIFNFNYYLKLSIHHL